MHLRSISMKGFKSFPDRTKLEFGTGVSVVVGPNGSGKSNITDAVLWALGEQSPLAVRGQVMKDVIFAGGHGVQGSKSAEVEVVIDNTDGRLSTDFSDISIVRRLNRDGEGEYRLNGARCRLVDVIEVLSDSGLGKEMHSVVSQGKVEQIVLSRPRERRLLIEEAAGLGKHRKRRRRAQLKLERTEDNLGRALDVEREARSRLRPLKRQAEAAELHERLERQTLEARYALARDATREARAALAGAEQRARAARSERDEAERLLGEVAQRREQAEQAFAAQTREREQIQAGLFSARSAAERIAMRLERVREQGQAATERGARRERELELLEADAARHARERHRCAARRAAAAPARGGRRLHARCLGGPRPGRPDPFARARDRPARDRPPGAPARRDREPRLGAGARARRAHTAAGGRRGAPDRARGCRGRDGDRPHGAPRGRARSRGGARPRRQGRRRPRRGQPVPAHGRRGPRRLGHAGPVARRGRGLRAGAGRRARPAAVRRGGGQRCRGGAPSRRSRRKGRHSPDGSRGLTPADPRRRLACWSGRRRSAAGARDSDARGRRACRAPAGPGLGGRFAERPARRTSAASRSRARAAGSTAPPGSCPRRPLAGPSGCSRSGAGATS